ncbi:uncharacterized protein BYT42DRAFT_333425 [Radiomyces spectabilis]|uniref:uncharacterized protein n=1 Tax=Radiomyces spectabilis TaxID=64574 RepID=UPI00222114F4|nr:uncharacterized protein BYT42DRAFT_333425 [Radiomyces spectabilis]KAI8379618.1 hypothetical protein BYT42DRAFT_333425 [Radiomyces spectabilis]
MFAAPICGCAQHLNHPVHPLAVNDCLRETWLDAALPVIFLLFSAIINTCRRYREWRNGFFRLPENDTDGLRLPLARPYVLLRRSLLLLVFCLLEISCWAFLFAWRLESAILERDNAELHSSNDACSTPLYQVIDPSVALIARIYVLVLVIKSFTTPADPVILSKLTVYNPHFLVFYSLALLSAVARIFSYFVIGSQTEWLTSSTIEKSFAIIDLVICIILWFVSATTPTELDPRELMDFEDDDSGVLVLHDGRTVRNGRILSMEATASPLSTVTFSWMNDLLEKAKKSPLMADQLWALPLRLRAQDNYRYFKRFTSKHLLHRLIRANLKTIIYQFFTAVAAVAFHYANAFYLLRLLNYIQDPQDQPKEVGYVYCGAIFACNVIGTLVASQTLLWGRRWHVTLSNMLNSEIYAHALQSSNASNVWKTETKHNAETDPTTLENQQATLMTQDTERLAELASYLHVFYTCPLEIAVGAIFLYKLLGNAFLAGLSVMVFALPAIHYISRKLTHVQKRLAEAKSWRVRLLTELCNGIKITKLMAWEQKWEQVITSARDDELVKLIKMYTQNTMLSLIWFAAPVFVTTVSFAWYTLVERNTLDASTAFVSIVVFGMLRDPLNVMPQALMAYSDAKVSLGHITTFLNSGEKHADTDSSPLNDPSILSYKSRSRTGFDSGVFGWPNPNTSNPKMSCTPHPSGSHSLSRTDLPPSNYGSTSNHGAPFASAGFALMVPTFDFPDASLSVIVGPSNSGKTSLLFALLGELVSNHGRSYLPLRFLSPRTSTIRDEHQPHLYAYRVAYVAQIPWIQSATVRENILFSEPWDDSRYRAVLYQCDLMKDLAAFENGDLTSVDDGGTFITETQRQKISLARAVYSKAKTVIIDDIFSTFSQATTRSLYTKCLNGELMQGRTIILACQRRDAEWFQDAKLIVHMEAGRADICETPESILEWIQTNTVPSDRDTVLRNDDHVDALFECGPALVEDDVFDERSIMRESTRYTEDDRGGHLPHQSRDMAYATYFSACGGWRFWMAAIVLTILARFASILESYWLKEGNIARDNNDNKAP